MGLTVSQISDLMAPVKHRAPKTNALVRVAGEARLENQQVKPAQFGRFEGKQGTKRRSRKGLVRTMPNGYVFYNGVTDTEVVAYRA
jgi:hypothetical protein